MEHPEIDPQDDLQRSIEREGIISREDLLIERYESIKRLGEAGLTPIGEMADQLKEALRDYHSET